MYKFALSKDNHEPYASGRVLYGKGAATNFPVRLASEIYQRCAGYLELQGVLPPYGVYDPMCGIGYTLAVLGFLHADSIDYLLGSDVDGAALEVAEKNLGLLSQHGLESRMKELEGLYEDFNRESHLSALGDAKALHAQVSDRSDILSSVFQSNVLNLIDNPELSRIDIGIVDLPYGQLKDWVPGLNEGNLVQTMAEGLFEKLPNLKVIAIISNKAQKVQPGGFNRVEKFQIGKRKVSLFS